MLSKGQVGKRPLAIIKGSALPVVVTMLSLDDGTRSKASFMGAVEA